jgi:hypothetical protein
VIALAKIDESSNEFIEFLTCNTPTPVPRRFCVPFDTVERIAAHFIETGDRWPGVLWEEI